MNDLIRLLRSHVHHEDPAVTSATLDGIAALNASSSLANLIALLETADVRVVYTENELIDATEHGDAFEKLKPTGWYAVGLLIRRHGVGATP